MRKECKNIELGKLGSFFTGYTPKAESLRDTGRYPYFKVSDMNHPENLETLQKTSAYLDDDVKFFPKGAIVFPKNGAAIATNKKRILGQDSIVDLNTGGFVCNDVILNNRFVYYMFLNLDFRHFIRGGAVPTLDIKELKKLLLPLPSLSDQQRIVEELDCLTGIIEKQKEQVEQLDFLARSIFREMFGDPVKNEKHFPVYKMSDVVQFQGGSQPNKKYFEYEPSKDNIRLIQIRDYKSDNYITYIPKSLARRTCNANDIMIGRYGPPIFQILKGIEGAYNVALMKAIPKKGNIEFIRAFLKQRCLLTYLEGLSKRTAGQDGIQMDKLKEYPFPYPPMELQNAYEEISGRIEEQKKRIKESIKETEELFNSRMDYYFN